MVHEGRAVDTTYLDLCKTLDTAQHDILVPNLERHGYDRLSIQCIRNWLDGHTQSVVINVQHPRGEQ